MSTETSRVITWFEIPAHDLERATRFYEAALDVSLQREVFGGVPMSLFGHAEADTGGCIVFNPPESKPHADGVLVYLNAKPSVTAALDRIEKAGGRKLGPAVELPNNIGYIGHFLDSEGNRVGLHAPRLA